LTSYPDAPQTEEGGAGDFHYGDRLLFPPVKVDRRLRDGDLIKLGDVTLKVVMTPGHTKGTITLLMKAAADGKKYNVVFAGSVSSKGYRLTGNANYPSIVEDFERTFSVLKKIPCDVFLTEHGFTFGLTGKIKRLEKKPSANPFIDPAGYLRSVESMEKNFYDALDSQLRMHQKN
jgi:metallo-beta-lactamase class B